MSLIYLSQIKSNFVEHDQTESVKIVNDNPDKLVGMYGVTTMDNNNVTALSCLMSTVPGTRVPVTMVDTGHNDDTSCPLHVSIIRTSVPSLIQHK